MHNAISRALSIVGQKIDATLLSPLAQAQDILNLCQGARDLGAKAVCVNSSWLPLISEKLRGLETWPIAVVGFPLGSCAPEAKAFEAQWCRDNGARELDTVVHLGHLKAGNWGLVREDIASIVTATDLPVKVIFEAHLLTEEEIIQLCSLCEEENVAYVKTSTGFGGGGAQVEHVALMRKHFSRGVKASGGIKSWAQAKKMLAAGATRLGTSSLSLIAEELRVNLEKNLGDDLAWIEQNLVSDHKVEKLSP